jgi:hypothetical protein
MSTPETHTTINIHSHRDTGSHTQGPMLRHISLTCVVHSHLQKLRHTYTTCRDMCLAAHKLVNSCRHVHSLIGTLRYTNAGKHHHFTMLAQLCTARKCQRPLACLQVAREANSPEERMKPERKWRPKERKEPPDQWNHSGRAQVYRGKVGRGNRGLPRTHAHHCLPGRRWQ